MTDPCFKGSRTADLLIRGEMGSTIVESGTLRIALGQYDTGWEQPALSLFRARKVVEHAAADGAHLVALPEMCTTGFTMDAATWAEPLDGPSASAFAQMARDFGIHVLAGMATREMRDGTECFHNSALLFAPDGSIAAQYRKQRLFVLDAEGDTYTPGDGPVVFDINGVSIAPLVCFDLRFPELFRAVSTRVDCIVLIASWPAVRRHHWDILTQARAIENQCYFAAVTRIGTGNGIAFNGGSVLWGPWGEQVAYAADADAAAGNITCATVETALVTRTRTAYPFVSDERPARV